VTAPSSEPSAAVRLLFEYLASIDPLEETPADAVIGFGTFDVTLASYCGDLYSNGQARCIVFTGGTGAGTMDLGQPEADAWRQQLARTHPTISDAHIILENESTNTAENIAFTARILARQKPELVFGTGLKTALVVASPSRLRRVKLTLAKMQPGVRVIRCLPPTATMEYEAAIYRSKGIDYTSHLVGEVARIIDYPERGWIEREPLPAATLAAFTELQRIQSG
jgi:hypothetical protein